MKPEILNNIKRIMAEAESAYKEKQTQHAHMLYKQALTEFEQVQQEEFTIDDWRQISYCKIYFVGTSLSEEKEQAVDYAKQAIEMLLHRVEPKISSDWRNIFYGYLHINNLTINRQEKINLSERMINSLNQIEEKTSGDRRKIADVHFLINEIYDNLEKKIEHAKQGIDSLNQIEEKTPEDRRKIADAHFRILKTSMNPKEKIEHAKQGIDSLNQIEEKKSGDLRSIATVHFMIGSHSDDSNDKIKYGKLGIKYFHELKNFFSLIDANEAKIIDKGYKDLNNLMSNEERIAYLEEMNNFYNNLIESSERIHFDPPAWRKIAWFICCMMANLIRDTDIEQRKTCLVNLLESINKIPREARIDDDLKKIAQSQFCLADCYSRKNDVEQTKKWFINSLGSFNYIMDKDEKSYQAIHQCYIGLCNFEIESTAKTFYGFASIAFSARQFTFGFELELNKLYAAIIALPPNHVLIRGLFCLLQLLPKANELEKFPNSAIKTYLVDPEKRAWINGLTEEMAKINNSLLTLSSLVEGSNHFSTLVAFNIKDLQARVKTLQGEKEELKTQNQMLKEEVYSLREKMEKMEALVTSLLPSKEEEKESEKQKRSDDEPKQPNKKPKIYNLFADSSDKDGDIARKNTPGSFLGKNGS